MFFDANCCLVLNGFAGPTCSRSHKFPYHKLTNYLECDYSYLWSKQLINCRIVRDLFGFRIYSESGSISLLLGREYNVKKSTIQRHTFQLMPTLPRTTGALFKGNLSFNFVTTLADSVGSISVLFLSSSSSLELYAVNASILGRVATWSRWGAKFNGAWLSP